MFDSILALSVAGAIAVAVVMAAAPSCKNPQQAENAVFTGEQLLCMTIPLVEDLLTGTPEEIASDIVRACPTLQGFTTEVVAFVNQWLKDAPQRKDAWRAYIAASPDAATERESWRSFVAFARKGPRVYPVATTDANAPASHD